MNSPGLPFHYMDKKAVLDVGPFKSNSNLCAKVKAGEFPEPDHIGGRAFWRSDVVGQWLTDRAAKADAERAERAKIAQARAQRMVMARNGKKAA